MVTIRNPADPDRQWTGRFLVDTGAFDSLVPRIHLEAIGLKPLASEQYVLADGSPIELSTTVGRIEFMGKIVGGTLVFGDADAEPLLGVTALKSGGFEVDPRTQRLKKLPAVLLKGLRKGRHRATAGQQPAPHDGADPWGGGWARGGAVGDDWRATPAGATPESAGSTP